MNKRKIAYYFLLFAVISFITIGKVAAFDRVDNYYQFIKNLGQWGNHIQYKADIPGGALFIERGAFTYHLYDSQFFSKNHGASGNGSDVLKTHGLKIQFLNSNKNMELESEDPTEEYFNYYLGQNATQWKSHVPAFKKVNLNNIYKDIDLDIYSQDHLKYDFIVQPLADPNQIKMVYEGAQNIAIKEGQLVVTTSVGEIIEHRPFAYQMMRGKREVVQCEFFLHNNQVSFYFPQGYNPDHQLIIDPELIFSTFSGSRADNFGYTATFDSEGFLFAAGSVFDIGYPVTLGAYQQSYKGGDEAYQNQVRIAAGTDIGITKYDTTGTKRVYSTYLGGSGTELPHSLVVDRADQLCIFGTTSSTDFPTLNAPQSSFKGGNSVFFRGLSAVFRGGTDIFVTKMNIDGTALIGSTYIGGTANDGLNTLETASTNLNRFCPLTYNYADEVRGEIDIDPDNNIYITTSTNSADFPVTPGIYQTTFGGQLDACIIKLSPNLNQILWSTYLGGQFSDASYAIVIDSNKDLYVTGGTNSPDFPVSAGVVQPAFRGGRSDGFITHLSQDGKFLLHSTFYGFTNYDQSYFVELDRSNNVHVYGQTEQPGRFYIKNALYNVPNSGQFISKFTPALDTIIWSTSFGTGSGTPNLSPTAFLVDLCSKIYLSGWGGATNVSFNVTNGNTFIRANSAGFTTNLPTTPDAQFRTTDGSDFYLMVLADDASQLSYGSFFGGNISHEHVDGGTSRFDRKGKIYQSVCGGCHGNSDFPIKPFNAVSPLNRSDDGCNNAVFKFDFKLPIVLADFKVTGCNPVTLRNTSLIQKATTYLWNFGDNTTSTDPNPVHTYARSGTYKVTLKLFDNLTCNLSDSLVKEVYISPLYDGVSATATPAVIYKNWSSQLQAFPSQGYTYQWSPAQTLNRADISNPVASPKDTTTYTVTITDPKNNCSYNAQVTVYVVDSVCGQENVFIPNAFTPNDDRNNDTLYVRGKFLADFNFMVYNRWGEKVFETQNEQIGWNGFYKSMKADPGVFVYYLEATCINREKFFKKGNITLIR